LNYLVFDGGKEEAAFPALCRLFEFQIKIASRGFYLPAEAKMCFRLAPGMLRIPQRHPVADSNSK
jgi:hypothetical protein